jgi:3-hydroxymyristoyl/3-hydroxydecanoyl-(acyl carrier protein) dehydratase
MSEFVIGDDHPALPGHFPGRPIVPGVVILDRVLDAIEAAHGPLGALRLPQVKFRRPLLPGQAARIEIDLVAPAQPQAPVSRWRFRVEHDGQLLASGEVAVA